MFLSKNNHIALNNKKHQFLALRFSGRDNEAILTSEMLLELPTELITELQKAALVQDRKAMTDLIQRIKALGPETAEGLRILVDGFQLGRIKELLGDEI